MSNQQPLDPRLGQVRALEADNADLRAKLAEADAKVAEWESPAQRPLHIRGCPYEPYSDRYLSPEEEEAAPDCTCPEEHRANYWKACWVLEKGKVTLAERERAEARELQRGAEEHLAAQVSERLGAMRAAGEARDQRDALVEAAVSDGRCWACRVYLADDVDKHAKGNHLSDCPLASLADAGKAWRERVEERARHAERLQGMADGVDKINKCVAQARALATQEEAEVWGDLLRGKVRDDCGPTNFRTVLIAERVAQARREALREAADFADGQRPCCDGKAHGWTDFHYFADRLRALAEEGESDG